MGERDCSIQRRNQKVLEEAPSPSPVMTPELRARMGADAVKVAAALSPMRWMAEGSGPINSTPHSRHFLAKSALSDKKQEDENWPRRKMEDGYVSENTDCQPGGNRGAHHPGLPGDGDCH